MTANEGMRSPLPSPPVAAPVSPPAQTTHGERLAERWRFLSPFVIKWCHEREWPSDWSGGECRLRHGHSGPHVNFAGRTWSENP